jgi:hypothetical protein
MDDVEKVLITKSQWHALNMIRGLHQDAFHMVIAAEESDGGYVLKGKSETFDHLLRDLYDEVEYELSPQTRLRHLRSLIRRIEPECIEF